MFTNNQRQEERTGKYGTSRVQYLQELATQFQNASSEETKERIAANLANFAYDPYNYTLLRQLNVLELFLDCITEANEKLVEFGVGGICNSCVDPANAAVITQCNGIPLIVECLSSPVRNTVSHEEHASQVLTRLGLEDCFEGVICFETLNPPPVENIVDENKDTAAENVRSSTILCKPALEAMEAAIEIANVDPIKTIFFDDSPRNIVSGKAAGLHTVIVGSSTLVAGADHALGSIHNIKEALPELWEGEEIDQFEPVVQPPTVETQVLA